MLRSVGWVPPYRCPSRRLLRSRDEGRSLITRSKVAPIPGLRPHRWLEVAFKRAALRGARGQTSSGGNWDEARDRPRERGHLAGDGHHHLVDVLAAGGELPVAAAQPHLRLPADGLHLGREFFEPQLEVSADLRWIAIGPG